MKSPYEGGGGKHGLSDYPSDGSMQFNPSFDALIAPDDTVIAVGETDNLRKLGWTSTPQVGVS